MSNLIYVPPNKDKKIISANLEILTTINDAVNDFPYAYDLNNWDFDEWWERIRLKGKGDCEDYALEKCLQLFEDCKWPRVELMLCTVATEGYTRENHAIAYFKSEGIDIYGDNRQRGLVTARDLYDIGYTPIRKQHFGGSGEWVKFGWQT